MNRPETLLDADEPDGRVAHRRGTGRPPRLLNGHFWSDM